MKKPKKQKTPKKHLSYDERVIIETMLNDAESISSIARKLQRPKSTISREIHRNVITSKATVNNCVHRRECIYLHICGNEACTKHCSSCARCVKYCSEYEPELCKKLVSLGICNSCKKKGYCTFVKRVYKASEAEKHYRNTLIGRRSGFDLTYEEIAHIDAIVSPRIQNGQSPYHIVQSEGDSLGISESTLRRLIAGCELDARDIDLKEKVRRKPRKTTNRTMKKEFLSKEKAGHKYEDYLEFISENDCSVVEMDCVEGTKDDTSVLLTLYFRAAKFQLAFIMREHTSSSVVDTLDKIETILGSELFSQMFPAILTDNGHEFLDIHGMERSINGDTRTKIFFCEPNRSDEKGGCENNHKRIRDIIPKGTSLEQFNQFDINKMMNHINSYKRKSLYGKTPYEVAVNIFPEDFFILLGIEQIPADKVIMSPKLLK